MKDDRFEAILKEALSPEISDEEIILKQKENTETMNRIKTKRMVLMGLAACIVFAFTAFAAGKIISLGTGDHVKTYESYEDMEKTVQDAGFDVIEMPESFTNGYVFNKVDIQDVDALDDGHNKVKAFKEFIAEYLKDGKHLTVYAAKEDPELNTGGDNVPAPKKVKTLDGVPVKAYKYCYKMLPDDYEITDEDREFMSIPGNYVSYGSKEVEYTDMSAVVFVKDGIRYTILDSNSAEYIEDMFDMAEELLSER